jgi:predicted RNase H-like HicB family nuclease
MAPFSYRVLIEFSAEDSVYVARIPAFEGLAAHGETAEEAAREARTAAEGMLASMKKHGRPAPEPDSAVDFSGQLRAGPKTGPSSTRKRESAEAVRPEACSCTWGGRTTKADEADPPSGDGRFPDRL